MKTKRFFAAVLSVIMICVGVPLTVSAMDDPPSTYLYEGTNFTYAIDGTEIIITGYDTTISANLIIPSVIDRKPVTAIKLMAFDNISSLETVTIPHGVTSIGDSAFAACTSLTTIYIPASVVIMGTDIFDSCNALDVYTVNDVDFVGFNYGYPFDSLIITVSDITYANTYQRPNSNTQIYSHGEGVSNFTALSGREGYTFAGWSPSSISTTAMGAVTITATWTKNPEPEVDTSVPPHLSVSDIIYSPSSPPAIPDFSLITQEAKNIDVIAILNKSGSVNSAKTRLEVLRAARTKGVTKITLILPEDCIGISTAAIQKCVKAAGSIPIFLSYDEKTVRLTSGSKQVLTKLYYSAK
ncbi:MAG: leucine-rich repeat domain-containing protein [Ruminococcus sp.]|jgi:hypothetical protein|nr:leucine-rich repeat domain-containing protein [Ruminococcus sp.]